MAGPAVPIGGTPTDAQRAALTQLVHQNEDSVMAGYQLMAGTPGIGEIAQHMMVEAVIHHERTIVNMERGNIENHGAWPPEVLQVERDRYTVKRREAETACGSSFAAWHVEQRGDLPSVNPDGTVA